jgi:hypothetical protein
MVRLGALKQPLKGILSNPKGCGKFLLAVGVTLATFFFQNGYYRTADSFQDIPLQFQIIDSLVAKL